jgi:hypothetical protein
VSYREENDQVILTMSREDYARLLMALGYAAGSALKTRERSVVYFRVAEPTERRQPDLYPVPGEMSSRCAFMIFVQRR